jgi:hypothetical protein
MGNEVSSQITVLKQRNDHTDVVKKCIQSL